MAQTNSPLILVADDDVNLREVLRLILERDGYQVHEVDNGEQAVAFCRQRLPDAVLMDILMPVVDGAAACGQIQALPGGGHVPVLMITALSDRQTIDRCFDAGATDYITKPINSQVLRRRIQRLLRARRAEANLRASEARLASIVATSTDAILLLDRDLRVRLTNPAAEHIFGYRQDEVLGEPISVLLPDQAAKCLDWAAQLSKEEDNPQANDYVQCEARRKDGTPFPAEISIGRFQQGERLALTVTLRDITLRKQAEAEIERRAQQLAALSQIGQAVTTRLDLDEVLRTVIDQVMFRLNAEGVSVLLLDQGELQFAAVNGASAGVLRGQRMPATAGIAGEIMRTGRATRVRTAEDRSRIYRDIEQVTQYHAQDVVAVPLKLGSEILGVMEAVHSQSYTFSDDDLHLLESAGSWAAIAIGNARQHQRLQRRLRESQTLAAIGRALNETLDLDQILQMIVAATRQLIPATDQAVILLVDEDAERVRVVTEQGQIERRRREDDQWERDPLGRAIVEKQLVHIEGFQGVAAPQLPGLLSDVHSLLAAPVYSGDVCFGVISTQSTALHAFDADDERLLLTLGDEAAIAIQNARLYQSEHTQRELAEALRDTAATISGSLDIDDVLDRILDNVGRVVPHDSAHIMLVESGVARMARWRGYDRAAGDQLRARRFSVMDTEHLRLMFESNQPLAIADTREFSKWNPLPGSRSVQSFIGAPIRIKRRLLGFVNLESLTAGFFGPEYTDRLQTFADQVAVAIENARLYQLEQEQFQRWQQSQASAMQAEKMEALARLASSLSRVVERPLQAMQENVQTALDDSLAAQQRAEALAQIESEVERLNQILRDVLSFATPAAEARHAVQITELIQQALASASDLLRQSQMQVTTDLAVTGTVLVAPQQMTQVFHSLILNAIEATQARGQLHIATLLDGSSIAILFVNDGPSISPAEMPHVFEPFFTTKPHSTGLGLAISHNIVQQQNGSLTVENLTMMGRGVTFTVKLPLAG